MEPTTTTPAASPVPAQLEPHTHNTVSQRENATLIEWAKKDLADGKISQDQFNRQAEELGVTPEQIAPDTRSEEIKSLDEQFPPAKPEDFTIHWGQEMTPELKSVDTGLRTWGSVGLFTREHFNSLVAQASRVTQQTARMTSDQLATYGQTEYAKLQRVYGDGLEAKLQAAARMVHVLDTKQPGLKNLLKSKGIGDNAVVVSMLIGQAERWHARRG